jgi:flagellar biosynthetic protein FlhB
MRLNPAAGFKRLFSINALFELGKSILKFIFLGTVSYFALAPVLDQVLLYSDRPLMDMVEYLHGQSVHLVSRLLIAFAFIAVIDLLYRRHEYFQNLKMTKTEVKDEYKQQEGDPAVKARLRQLRLEKSRKRMMAQVPKADVVITNPTHYAVALQYDSEKFGAPILIAKGINTVALKIREIAEESQVTIVSNPPLARVLHDTVEIDHQIPSDQYKAVAEIISYVYKLKKRSI